MKDYLVNVVSGLVVAALGWAFNRYALGNTGGGLAEFWALLGAVALFGSLLVTLRLNRLRDAYVAAHSFDYKFYAVPANDRTGNLGGLYRMFGQASIDAFGHEPVTKKAGTDGYIPAKQFFSADSVFMSPGLFECRAVRNDEKAGKLFVQLSFIPVDRDGRTLLIRRDPLYHGSEFGGAKKPTLSFLSFSPIPTRFHMNAFRPVDAYCNEVPKPWGPMAGVDPAFDELGAVVRFDAKNKATYLFYVFAVRYPDVRFSGRTNGAPNTKWLFFRDEKNWRKRTPFGKDHDSVAAVIGVGDLLEFVLRGTLPSAGHGASLRKRLETLRLRHLLKHVEFKEVECRALQNLAGAIVEHGAGEYKGGQGKKRPG